MRPLLFRAPCGHPRGQRASLASRQVIRATTNYRVSPRLPTIPELLDKLFECLASSFSEWGARPPRPLLVVDYALAFRLVFSSQLTLCRPAGSHRASHTV